MSEDKKKYSLEVFYEEITLIDSIFTDKLETLKNTSNKYPNIDIRKDVDSLFTEVKDKLLNTYVKLFTSNLISPVAKETKEKEYSKKRDDLKKKCDAFLDSLQ